MREELKLIQEVLDKYFRDYEKIMYFTQTDLLKMLSGETHLRYEYYQGRKDSILIWLCSTNFEEMPIKICNTAEELDTLIKAIVY